MVLRPELVLQTLVTGPELVALLYLGVGTLCSLSNWTGIQSSGPCLIYDSSFRSCDQGLEHKFRSKHHGRGLEIRSFGQ